MARLGVVGSINLDTITRAAGVEADLLGGILYTACAAAHLGGGAVEIELVARLSVDVSDRVLGLLRGVPGVRTTGLLRTSEPGFRSDIQYADDGRKTEILMGDLPPLRLDELRGPLAGVDGLLVNFITGYEVELEALCQVRTGLGGPVLMDVHSLTLGRSPLGERFWHRPPNWREWLGQADVVQMNEEEAALLGGLSRAGADELLDFGRYLLDLGPQAAAITRGTRGALGVWRGVGGTVNTVDVPAQQPHLAIDATGCGDVFLAGLGIASLAGHTFDAAVDLATTAASLCSRHAGIQQLHCLAGAREAEEGS